MKFMYFGVLKTIGVVLFNSVVNIHIKIHVMLLIFFQ